MPRAPKQDLPDIVFNNLIKIILDVDGIQNTQNINFSKEDMRVRNVVNKYVESNIGEQLRKYMYIKHCTKIRKEHEKCLTEDDILTIFRSVLKLKNYTLVGSTDPHNFRRYCVTGLKV